MNSTSTSPAILVAGGAGYIGSHTAKLLARNGFVPVVIDSLVTGNRQAIRFGPFYEGSTANKTLVKEICDRHQIAGAILFAAHAYVGESTQQPAKYYGNNISASLAFVDALLESGVTSLVFSSSCSIYGLAGGDRPIEENTPKCPLSPYAESKWMFEQMLSWYGRSTSLKSACLRYFNAAGADPEGELGEWHDPETHLIPLTILAALGKGPLRVFGTDYPTPDGTAIRDYVHVTDLATAHIASLRRLLGGADSFAVNLGTGQGHSVRQIIEAVSAVGGCNVPVEYGPRREGDAPSLVADPTLARELLGWRPQHSSLDSIVGTAWRWYSRTGDPFAG
jgi:UDP-arabinose 4-epimerase